MEQKTQLNENKRLNYIDVARGITIILMLVGHTECPIILKNYIYGFHMPFFFILSGYLYNEDKYNNMGFKRFFITKFKAYIIPYFMLSFVNLVINIPIEYIQGVRAFKEILYSNLKHVFWIFVYVDTGRTPNCTPLWFLLGLFFATLLFYLVLKVSKNRSITFKVVIFAVLLMLVCVLNLLNYNIPILWNIDTAIPGAIFMYIGYIIKENKLLDKIEKIKWISILLIIAGSCAIIKNGRIDIKTLQCNNIVLCFVGAITISLVIFMISKCLLSRSNVLSFFGKNTMIIMGFNYFVNSVINIMIKRIDQLNDFDAKWIIFIILDIVVCSIIIVLWNYLKKLFPKLKKLGF